MDLPGKDGEVDAIIGDKGAKPLHHTTRFHQGRHAVPAQPTVMPNQ
jgi:hypothetical protein